MIDASSGNEQMDANGTMLRSHRMDVCGRLNKKLLGAPGIATRSKDATRGSWPYY